MRRSMTGVLAAALLCLGCAAPSAPTRPAPREKVWRYEVETAAGDALFVRATFPPQAQPSLFFLDGMAEFVDGFALRTSAGRKSLEARDGNLTLPRCRSGCELEYRFALGRAADAFEDVGVAQRFSGVLIAQASTWLLHPQGKPQGFQLSVATSQPGQELASGFVPQVSSRTGATELHGRGTLETPLVGLGSWQAFVIELDGQRIAVAVAPGDYRMNAEAMKHWLERVCGAVARYYGRFPASYLSIMVVPNGGSRGPIHGVTFGGGGASVLLRLRPSLTEVEALSSWVPTHELMHVGFPSLKAPHRWLEEGLATYLEPLIRARDGVITKSQVWHDLLRDAPKGLPEPGDRGLNATPTWGRTYWGGAVFCLFADVRIREQTNNRRSLDDALRSIVARGGNVTVNWPIERVLEVGDEATGTKVLSESYREFALAPTMPALAALWRDLGVSLEGDRVVWDDAAPLSRIRDALTSAQYGEPQKFRTTSIK